MQIEDDADERLAFCFRIADIASKGTKGLDGQENSVHEEPERHGTKDEETQSVSEAFAFGSISESQNNLKPDSEQVKDDQGPAECGSQNELDVSRGLL